MEALAPSTALETGRWALLAVLLAAPLALADATPLEGDVAHGGRLFREQCASCHGDGSAPTDVGAKLKTTNPKDPQLLLARTDEQLYEAIAHGLADTGMPGFARSLSALDVHDLVGWLRQGAPHLQDFFPEAGAYAVKTYTIDRDGQTRISHVVDALTPQEATAPVAAMFKTESGDVPTTGPAFVPQDPVALDTLAPRRKAGYVVFVGVAVGKATPSIGFGLGPDLSIRKLLPAGADSKARDALAKQLAPFVGLGGRLKLKQPLAPKSKVDAALTRAMTRGYLRAAEAVVMYEKEESARHLFDDDSAAPKAADDAPKDSDIKLGK